MGNVDGFDAHRSRYFPQHRNTTWRRTAFFSMMKFPLVNSWRVVCFMNRYRRNREKISQKQSLLSIRDELGKIAIRKQDEKRKESMNKTRARKRKYKAQQRIEINRKRRRDALVPINEMMFEFPQKPSRKRDLSK